MDPNRAKLIENLEFFISKHISKHIARDSFESTFLVETQEYPNVVVKGLHFK